MECLKTLKELELYALMDVLVAGAKLQMKQKRRYDLEYDAE